MLAIIVEPKIIAPKIALKRPFILSYFRVFFVLEGTLIVEDSEIQMLSSCNID